MFLALFAATACSSESGSSPDEEEPSDPPSAADGTDYSACDDGSCEVAVSEPVDFEFEDFTLSITAVIEDGIETKTTSPDGGTGSGSMAGGYCVHYFSANSSGGSCYGTVEGEIPVPDPAPGELALELLDETDGTAIIRLTMG